MISPGESPDQGARCSLVFCDGGLCGALAFAARWVILRMHQAYLFIVTAFVEVGTGLLLLFLPAVPLALLLGVSQAAPEAICVGRIAGAALLAIGVACWLARNDRGRPAQRGLLTGVLIYDLAAAALLAYAGVGLSMVGVALWPAVVLHAALAAWCVVCLWSKPRGETCGGESSAAGLDPVSEKGMIDFKRSLDRAKP